MKNLYDKGDVSCVKRLCKRRSRLIKGWCTVEVTETKGFSSELHRGHSKEIKYKSMLKRERK